ncbi:BCCT family transporter [Desulfuromonas acetoxidans]|uniref:Choline/carnitine/betaine transport n=1 Tax=Desulfuromonas acetoxidans (strain DSM 684 / 11070) TaxID=281689 RepID=Q1JYX9_DESA6|nr:BCCT family transporter [Desulfuromonas acetoxidans]EAT15515.1 choline/carnitine/betaine transport [Desulfuromonas acetoxidans DSM 684]MBF0646706.1 BCCT family transporter [Desulfuromonas acetoxidans]NVD25803.1 BCCT family transporter [Desulfuromonas acetoxidans]NVE17781.1 BCCT family transporter [Desulfuromonas acetoxidans]
MADGKKDNTVFYASVGIVVVILAWGIAAQEHFSAFGNNLLAFLTNNFGWAYLASMFIFVVFAMMLAFSKYGSIKLGADDSKPEFSTSSWFAMLFGAGMGIGLVFWGVAEPISHLAAPPGLKPGSPEAAAFAMRASFKHWGFHPWANYSIIGLALAYFQFRKGAPGLISSLFLPLIGEKGVRGPIGKTVDTLAVFATVAGVATSLGLGTLQINSGFNSLFKIPENNTVALIIIAVVTVIFIWTAVSGVNKGIKVLGDINLFLAATFIILAFLVGPKVKILNALFSGFGGYISTFIQGSFNIKAYGDNSWVNGWTVFYWAWWIAWAPFVGSFIARISKGRTIREFIIGVTVAPAMASFLWFAVFGTLGLNLMDSLGLEQLARLAGAPESALFVVMAKYPLGWILSMVAIVLLCTFFITSANSATFVLGMFTSGGDLNPSNQKKIFWGLVQSALAAVLLLAGGLKPLQTISVAAAFPFILIMLAACVSLLKALKEEKLPVDERVRELHVPSPKKVTEP